MASFATSNSKHHISRTATASKEGACPVPYRTGSSRRPTPTKYLAVGRKKNVDAQVACGMGECEEMIISYDATPDGEVAGTHIDRHASNRRTVP